MEQRKEFTGINIKLYMVKHKFSEEFSNVLHEFSKQHYREPLKIFRESWKIWISNNEIILKIKTEIEKMQKLNIMWSDEEIMKKIYTSARFYYRKKEKKEKKENNDENNEKNNDENKEQTRKSKPYIGFNKDFIKLIDNTIKENILQKTIDDSMTNLNTKKTIILNQKQSFYKFTLEHINEINEELGKLKSKYDEFNEKFEPYEIALKIKKAYVNRFYLISKILQNSSS